MKTVKETNLEQLNWERNAAQASEASGQQDCQARKADQRAGEIGIMNKEQGIFRASNYSLKELVQIRNWCINTLSSEKTDQESRERTENILEKTMAEFDSYSWDKINWELDQEGYIKIL